MSNLQIKQLYNHKRGPDGGVELFCLLLYLPFGILLFVVRLLIALFVLLLGYILPNTEVAHNILFKLICLSLGISINIKNPDKKEDVEVYVSNCLSNFDHLAVHAVTGAVMPGSKMKPVLARALGTHDFGNITNFEAFKKNISVLISENKIPVYFRPEAKLTNGKALLKFKAYPFSFSSKVQPICIEVSRPFLRIAVTTIGANYWQNVFFFMFSPSTIYNLQFLPVLEKKNLTDAEFAEIVRQNISTVLKVEMSSFTNSDLLEWEKRFNAEQQSARAIQRPPVNQNNTQVHRMAMQVREVLPDVPYDAVYKDLLKTKNVDHTISNILEGHVRYIPESQQQKNLPSTSSNMQQSSATTSKSSGTVPTNAASCFGKSAHERSLSFQERKRRLIENARKRYIEKHNLNVLALNNC